MDKTKIGTLDLPIDKRKYPGQQCQNDRINYKFRQLHKHIINDIITFCNAYHISIDEIHINADGLAGSIEYGSWQACTDSSFELDKFTDEYKDVKSMKKIVSNDEWERIKLEQEPYLFSM
jgi:hypothetical protein